MKKYISLLPIFSIIISIVFPIIIGSYYNSKLEKIKTELSRDNTKHLEIWRLQKDTILEFVDFLEVQFFNNPDIENNPEEQEKFLRELNHHYAKLYMVADENTISQINKTLNGWSGKEQRFYLYRELRLQILSTYCLGDESDRCKEILENKSKEKFTPSIMSKVENATNPTEQKFKDCDELKKVYEFIECNKEENKYKTIPFYTSGEGNKK